MEISDDFLFGLERSGLTKEYCNLSRTLDYLSDNGGPSEEEIRRIEERFKKLEAARENLRPQDRKYIRKWAGVERDNIDSYFNSDL